MISPHPDTVLARTLGFKSSGRWMRLIARATADLDEVSEADVLELLLLDGRKIGPDYMRVLRGILIPAGWIHCRKQQVFRRRRPLARTAVKVAS